VNLNSDKIVIITTRFNFTITFKDQAQQLGAKVIKNKQEISPGYYAVMEDPQKNTFGIWQGKK
jgi:predicted enzyme related to lactoylglutathione lyase